MPAPEAHWILARILALKSLPAFQHLEADDLSVLAERAEHRHLEAGEALFDAERGPEQAHLVIQGAVREERFGKPFRRVEPYDLVAPMDLLGGCSGRAGARAEGAAATLTLDRSLLLDVLEENFDALRGAIGEVAATAIRARRRLGPRAGHAGRAEPGGGPPGELDLVARILALRRSGAFGNSRLSALGHLALDSEPLHWTRGSEIWQAGDPADHGLLIVAGRVACTSADGEQHFELGAGEVLGLDDALSGSSRWHAACIAPDVDTHALRIDTSTLIDVLEDDPETAVAGLTGAARAVAGLLDRLARGGAAPAAEPA